MSKNAENPVDKLEWLELLRLIKELRKLQVYHNIVPANYDIKTYEQLVDNQTNKLSEKYAEVTKEYYGRKI